VLIINTQQLQLRDKVLDASVRKLYLDNSYLDEIQRNFAGCGLFPNFLSVELFS
jgi:hypothetical protein